MLAFLYYCLKVIVCSGILYGYYLLALHNNRFHQWNRWYLLAAVVLSFGIPFLQLPLPDFFHTQPQTIYSGEAVALPAFNFAKKDTGFHFSLPLSAVCIYAATALFLLLRLAKNIRAIQQLKQAYPQETIGNVHFYNTTEAGTPFSFFKNIFWNSSISLHTEKGGQMLRHEMAHVTERHSADKVFLQILTALAFWNPLLYLIKKEVAVVHEFIADQKASAGDDQLQYASLLLMKAMGSQQFALGNSFFHSQLKRRLFMLTTHKNPRFSYLRRLLVLPLAAISLILFSFKYKQIKDKQKAAPQNQTTTVGEEEFYGDTTKPKFYIQLNKTYKGSAIESIMPTTDMSGAIVKTADDKTYFLDRAVAAKELNFLITDTGFTAPPGAVLVTETRKIITTGGAYIQMSPNSSFPQHFLTIDTTALGFSKALASGHSTIRIIPNQDMHVDMQITDGSIKMNKDVNIEGLDKALIIIDGVKIDFAKLKELDVKSFKTLDILKKESAIARYGEAGKDGVIIITTKAKESLPDNPLYILDGVESNKVTVDHILPENVLLVDVLKGETAVKVYGAKGKNGVIKVTTKLAQNEVTFPEANQDNGLAEKVVIGHRINRDSSTAKMQVPVTQSNKPNEVMVKGYKIPKPSENEKVVIGQKLVKDSSAVKTGTTATLAKQSKDLNEVVVVGYQKKNDLDKVFTKVDKPASFPGGLDGWRKYLERNLQYPEAAQQKGTQGIVKVKMIVAEDGSITELKALNDPGNGLAEEAVRVLKNGPKWIPALLDGKPVNYQFAQTLTFQLQ